MLTCSNVLSLSRAGFALAFLHNHPWIRIAAVVCAMCSDILDGFIARKQGSASHFGAILDPVMDKFFVFFAAGMLYREASLSISGLVAFFARDVGICLFGLYLFITAGWKEYECKSIFWGKATTTVQFIVLILLCFNGSVSHIFFWLLTLCGIAAFIELFLRKKRALA